MGMILCKFCQKWHGNKWKCEEKKMANKQADEFYKFNLDGKSASDIADVVQQWQDDDGDGEPFGHACDLLDAIKIRLRQDFV